MPILLCKEEVKGIRRNRVGVECLENTRHLAHVLSMIFINNAFCSIFAECREIQSAAIISLES